MNIYSHYDKNSTLSNVSVVIPTYNRVAMLQKALDSVFEQTYTGTIEIIVVDDCSCDGTPEIVRENYPDVRLVVLSKNSGPSVARNKGITLAKGRYVAFLDSDDLWEPDYLRTQISTLENHTKGATKVFCVSGLCVWEDAGLHKSYREQGPHPKYSSPLHHLLSEGSFIHTPSSAVFPQEAFETVGLFDESLRFAEDTDLYIRMLLRGYQAIFTKKPLAIRRMHNQGQAIEFKNVDLRLQVRLRAVEKYYPLIAGDSMLASVQQIKAEIYANFATQCYRKSHLWKWIVISRRSVQHTSWQSVVSRVINHDIAYTGRKTLGFLRKR